MKNSILLLLVLLSLEVSAQFNIGVKSGINVANFNGFTKLMDPRIGFHAGLFAEKKLTDKVSMQAELLYSQKGSRQDVLFPFNENDLRWVRFQTNYTYLDIPFLIKYELFKGFSPYMGKQLCLLVRKNAKLKGYDTDKATISGQGRLHYGLVAGVMYNISDRIGADIRYSRELLGAGFKSHMLQAGLNFTLFTK